MFLKQGTPTSSAGANSCKAFSTCHAALWCRSFNTQVNYNVCEAACCNIQFSTLYVSCRGRSRLPRCEEEFALRHLVVRLLQQRASEQQNGLAVAAGRPDRLRAIWECGNFMQLHSQRLFDALQGLFQMDYEQLDRACRLQHLIEPCLAWVESHANLLGPLGFCTAMKVRCY
jgi:hypothetical protein